ncbi:hypothetical protein T03_11288 [Trichinella britovi]|uniref:Uncharacterized protein n=1 Tax=Trichinella britovi TaxID=45882 RepID=A0A0V1CL45_TRIBR|nr:hypothetical protein T03_11288 [Trichinella britovi]
MRDQAVSSGAINDGANFFFKILKIWLNQPTMHRKRTQPQSCRTVKATGVLGLPNCSRRCCKFARNR